MASFEMPNVEGLNTVEELKNAVGKMTKELSWLLNNIDWKNINEINISLNNGAFVKIDDEGFTINNGQADTFKADINGKTTATGITVQSSNGYPKVVIDPDSNLFGAYASDTQYVRIVPLQATTNAPQVIIASPNGNLNFYQISAVSYLLAYNSDMLLQASKDITLTPGALNHVNVAFDGLLDKNAGTTLYQQLLGKAAKGSQTGTSGSANGGIPIGTQLMIAGGGTVTWTGIPNHSHTQN